MTHDETVKKVLGNEENIQEVRSDVDKLVSFVLGARWVAGIMFVFLLATLPTGAWYFINKLDNLGEGIENLRGGLEDVAKGEDVCVLSTQVGRIANIIPLLHPDNPLASGVLSDPLPLFR